MIKYLEKLLNGREVEWKKLGDICEINKGTQLNKELLDEKGLYPVINGGINPSGYWHEYNTEKNNIVISQGGASAGFVNWVDVDFFAGAHAYVIKVNENINNKKYIYYFLKYSQNKFMDCKYGAGIPSLSKETLINFMISIPPLDIQEDIVRVLDKFTEHTKELTKELTLRKKEYSYYRDYLLEFNNIDNLGIEVNRVKLSDIAVSMFRGNGIKKDEVDINGDIACVRYGEIYTMYNTYFEKCISRTNLSNILNPKYIEKGDLLFAITGESIEDIAKTTVYLGEEKALVGGDILVLRHKQNPKYLSYALSTQDAIKQKMKGKVKSKVVHTNAEDIGNIEIFLPSQEIQERIVNVLDNFEKICNDLNIGLPKEIELRQKEYEYYREYILTNIGNRITLEDKTI